MTPLTRPNMSQGASTAMSVSQSVRSDPFGARSSLTTSHGTTVTYYRLATLAENGLAELEKLPVTVRILLENLIRHAGTEFVDDDDVTKLAAWTPESSTEDVELAFLP